LVVLRLFALILLVVALMLLGADVVSTFELGGQFVTRSLETIVVLLSGVNLSEWIEATFPAAMASILIAICHLPGWLSTGVLGVLLAFLSAGRRKPQ
jgi:hypothetical protein